MSARRRRGPERSGGYPGGGSGSLIYGPSGNAYALSSDLRISAFLLNGDLLRDGIDPGRRPLVDRVDRLAGFDDPAGLILDDIGADAQKLRAVEEVLREGVRRYDRYADKLGPTADRIAQRALVLELAGDAANAANDRDILDKVLETGEFAPLPIVPALASAARVGIGRESYGNGAANIATELVGGKLVLTAAGSAFGKIAKTAPAAESNTLGSLTRGEALRIQSFADKYGTTVNVVGSRAKGTAGPLSDFDYILGEAGATSKLRGYARQQLPRGISGGEIGPDGIGTGIDVFKAPLDPTRPFIPFNPKAPK